MVALVLVDHAPQVLVRQFVQDNQVRVQVLDNAQAPCQVVDHFPRVMQGREEVLVPAGALVQVGDIPAPELLREAVAEVLALAALVVPVVVGLVKLAAHLDVAALKAERVIVNRNLERLVAKR
jgi:hypothetical protein